MTQTSRPQKDCAAQSHTDHRFHKNDRPVYICTGGTGGHVFPALSIIEVLQSRHPHCPITLIIDKKNAHYVKALMQSSVFSRIVLPLQKRSGGILTKVSLSVKLVHSALKCFFLFLKRRPAVVVGFGGYACAAPLFIAQVLGIPTILHEQNAYLGKVNRLLAKRARKLALTFEKTYGCPPSTPAEIVGNPVRITPCAKRWWQKSDGPARDQEASAMSDYPLHVTIIGGSQGAASFSTFFPKVLSQLSDKERGRIHLYQQCRAESLEDTKKAYGVLGLAEVHLAPFFEDMQTLYENSDIVISRAGASTVTELVAAKRPAFFIPYPYAADDHQYHNACAVDALKNDDSSPVEEGAPGVYVIKQSKLTPQAMAIFFRTWLKDPKTLQKRLAVMQSCMPSTSKNPGLRIAAMIEDFVRAR